MNNLNKVTPEVDDLVRRVARELGYNRNRAAHALKTGRHNVIGCIMPSLLSPVFPEIAQAVQQRAEEHGFATFVIDTGRQSRQRERETLRVLAEHGVDGAVAILGSRPDIADPPLFPMVAIDQQIPGLDSVRGDHLAGGRLMAEHAAAMGHIRVGMLSGEQDLASSRERRKGFLEAAAGKLEISWDVHVPLTADLPQEALEAIGRRDVTMIACVNDLIAMATLSALRHRKIEVPLQVSVMGFDDMLWAGWPLLDLTTVRQPLADLGRNAVDLLIRRIGSPDAEVENRVLPVSFVRRGSTMALTA